MSAPESKALQPYAANAEGLTAVLTDLLSTMPEPVVSKVTGYIVNAFEKDPPKFIKLNVRIKP